jgi:hypothetical protein
MAIDDCLADMPSRREAEKMDNEHVILRQEPWMCKARPRQYVPEDERDPAGGSHDDGSDDGGFDDDTSSTRAPPPLLKVGRGRG